MIAFKLIQESKPKQMQYMGCSFFAAINKNSALTGISGDGLMRMAFTLLIAVIFLVPLTSCSREQEESKEYLEFKSGGDYHPSGCGEWSVRLLGDGSLDVIHTVMGKVVLENTYMLTKDESGRLFDLFCSVNIKRLRSSTRQGLPDEVRYVFVQKDGSGIFTKQVWINDAREKKEIMDLITYTEGLITKYTGEKPVIR